MIDYRNFYRKWPSLVALVKSCTIQYIIMIHFSFLIFCVTVTYMLLERSKRKTCYWREITFFITVFPRCTGVRKLITPLTHSKRKSFLPWLISSSTHTESLNQCRKNHNLRDRVRRFRIKFFASKRNEAKRDPFRFLFERSSEKKLTNFLLLSLSLHQIFLFVST